MKGSYLRRGASLLAGRRSPVEKLAFCLLQRAPDITAFI